MIFFSMEYQEIFCRKQ